MLLNLINEIFLFISTTRATVLVYFHFKIINIAQGNFENFERPFKFK